LLTETDKSLRSFNDKRFAMSDFTLDELDRGRFDWPEPLLIEAILEAYDRPAGSAGSVGALTAARLQVKFLRALIDGERRDAACLRMEVIACGAARGIDLAAIEAADCAAFRDLVAIVESRFRTSPRLRLHFTQRLCDGLARLPRDDQPAAETATVRQLNGRFARRSRLAA
jgi:hypothetical protein